jgi:hypothetical protein
MLIAAGMDKIIAILEMKNFSFIWEKESRSVTAEQRKTSSRKEHQRISIESYLLKPCINL